MIHSIESKINLKSNAREYVRRSTGTRNNLKYTIKTVKFGSGSFMVWGYKLVKLMEHRTTKKYTFVKVPPFTRYSRM